MIDRAKAPTRPREGWRDIETWRREVSTRANNSKDHIESSSDVHGIGSGNDVVGTGTEQTLTLKTIVEAVVSTIYQDAAKTNLLTLPAATDTLVGKETTDVFKNKTIDDDDNILQNIALSALKAIVADADKVLRRDGSGNVVSGNGIPNNSDLVTTDASQTLSQKTLITPTIADFTNAQHNHQAASGGGKIDHGSALDGLADDDHTQYVLANGTRNVDFSSGSFKIGDVSGGNNLEIEADGTAKFNGNATVWDDQQVNIAGVKLPASGAPTWTAYKSGFVLAFAAAADNKIYFTVQLPHGYKIESDIEFHLHLAYPDANSGNVKWNFSHSWAGIGNNFPAATVVSDLAAASGVADKHVLEEIASTISGSGVGTTVSSFLICSLEREGTHIDDTYGSDVYLVGLDFHVEKDTIGSREEASK